MPQTKSAKKSLRQSKRRVLRNLAIRKKLKAAVKKFKNQATVANFIKVQSLVDSAAKKRIISKNRAARIKSKLTKLLAKIAKTPKKKAVPEAKKNLKNAKKLPVK